jgi:hypothetical protein
MQPYNNPRLDPANFKDGPLSVNAATRLRQMLARPGVIVRPYAISTGIDDITHLYRFAPVYSMVC